MLGIAHRLMERGNNFHLVIRGLLLATLALAIFAGNGGKVASAQRTFPLDTPVATTARTNLLDQPSGAGTLVAVMPTNSRAIVIGGPFNNGWYWLEYNEFRGYAEGKVLVAVDANYQPIAEATATNPPAPPPATATNTPLPAKPTDTPVPANTPAVKPTDTAPADQQPQVPVASGSYEGLWIGEMSYGGNVRNGPAGTRIKSWWAGRRVLLYGTATDSKGGVWHRVSEAPEPPMYVHASLIRKVAPVKFEGAKFKGKWVNINISQQVVTAYENGTPVKVTLTSTGTKKNPTELGVWKIYYRLPKQDMDGGSLAAGDYYNLKDVPFVQYFHNSGEGLHGTYWHDDFGRPRSHGCVNLSIPMSEWFYGWAKIGTIVWVHN